MTFKDFKDQELASFESYLEEILIPVSGTNLEEAMNYSLLANGKRLRPLLLLATVDAFKGEIESAYPPAAALEMVHAYSLIHDDLPAMDNDDLRRGLPTNHIKFSEATAILAGDSLLTHAFSLLASADLPAKVIVNLVALLSKTSGYQGMVGGQKADIDGEQAEHLTLNQLESIHKRKTGELIRFALVGGAMISMVSDQVIDCLNDLSSRLGIAYQIRDDILDVIGTVEDLGKAVGADEKLGKSTYPKLLGIEGAKGRLSEELQVSSDLLEKISDITPTADLSILKDFIDRLNIAE